jgi:hypothetical protein
MQRIRGKLTYSNVVATLALFLILAGGSAVAAKQMLPKNSVGTKQIKNNAITGTKIKNGAITGAKISTSSLGTVPSATHADSATTATSASHAASADSATNANSLGGIPAKGFMSSGRFGYGSASTDSAIDQTLFSLGGLEVRTAGSAGSTFRVKLRNTNSDLWEFGTSASSSVFILPGMGGETSFEDTASRAMQITGVDVKDTSKSITIQCGSDNGPNLLFCFAQASPGA